jgi:hypothetical protein
VTSDRWHDNFAGNEIRLFLSRVTCHSYLELAPEVGIAPTSPRLQRGANLPQLLRVRLRATRYDAMKAGLPTVAQSEGWSSRAVTLRGLPVISRALCF